MRDLNCEYFKSIFDIDFLNKYFYFFINGKFDKKEYEDEISLDLVFEKQGIDYGLAKENGKFELETIFFHVKNENEGYFPFMLELPFKIDKEYKNIDIQLLLGKPNKVNQGIPKIGLNHSEIFERNGFNLVFEYNNDFSIKTFSIQTKYNKSR